MKKTYTEQEKPAIHIHGGGNGLFLGFGLGGQASEQLSGHLAMRPGMLPANEVVRFEDEVARSVGLTAWTAPTRDSSKA